MQHYNNRFTPSPSQEFPRVHYPVIAPNYPVRMYHGPPPVRGHMVISEVSPPVHSAGMRFNNEFPPLNPQGRHQQSSLNAGPRPPLAGVLVPASLRPSTSVSITSRRNSSPRCESISMGKSLNSLLQAAQRSGSPGSGSDMSLDSQNVITLRPTPSPSITPPLPLASGETSKLPPGFSKSSAECEDNMTDSVPNPSQMLMKNQEQNERPTKMREQQVLMSTENIIAGIVLIVKMTASIILTAGTGADIALEAQVKADIALEAKVKADIALEAQVKADAALEAQARADAALEAQARENVDPGAQAREDVDLEAQARADVDLEAQARADVALEAQARADVALKVTARADIALEVQARADVALEAKARAGRHQKTFSTAIALEHAASCNESVKSHTVASNNLDGNLANSSSNLTVPSAASKKSNVKRNAHSGTTHNAVSSNDFAKHSVVFNNDVNTHGSVLRHGVATSHAVSRHGMATNHAVSRNDFGKHSSVLNNDVNSCGGLRHDVPTDHAVTRRDFGERSSLFNKDGNAHGLRHGKATPHPVSRRDFGEYFSVLNNDVNTRGSRHGVASLDAVSRQNFNEHFSVLNSFNTQGGSRHGVANPRAVSRHDVASHHAVFRHDFTAIHHVCSVEDIDRYHNVPMDDSNIHSNYHDVSRKTVSEKLLKMSGSLDSKSCKDFSNVNVSDLLQNQSVSQLNPEHLSQNPGQLKNSAFGSVSALLKKKNKKKYKNRFKKKNKKKAVPKAPVKNAKEKDNNKKGQIVSCKGISVCKVRDVAPPGLNCSRDEVTQTSTAVTADVQSSSAKVKVKDEVIANTVAVNESTAIKASASLQSTPTEAKNMASASTSKTLSRNARRRLKKKQKLGFAKPMPCPIEGCSAMNLLHGPHMHNSHIPRVLRIFCPKSADFSESLLEKKLSQMDQGLHFLAGLVGCTSLEELLALAIEDIEVQNYLNSPAPFDFKSDTVVAFAKYKGGEAQSSRRDWLNSRSPALLLLWHTLVPIINRLSPEQRLLFASWESSNKDITVPGGSQQGVEAGKAEPSLSSTCS
ncbi:P-selectin glycoprotein ligand 1 [Elysia marginata]|uniref:P-selectin glycoprotein ligand 1 n=1 Tax=Elysia marginata TaxID=1093978 RepID=A0AAV4GUF3_9GAST|nr:P-selectin glycoprotein ligand 1 [Elysia marginata]